MLRRIAIDGRFITSKRTGVGRYTLNFLRAILDIPSGFEFTIFVNDFNNELSVVRARLIRTSVTTETHPAQELWENLILPVKLKKLRASLFHSPAFFLPICTPGVKKVVTIHDLAVFKFPETFPKRFAEYLKFMVRISVKVADRIIAVSHSVRNDLVDILKVNEKKILVVHEGIDEVFMVKGGEGVGGDFKESKGLTRGFILYAGTIEPRKNIKNLIKAFGILKDRGLPHKLVLAGKTGWLAEGIIEEAKKSRFRDEIIFTGYIPDIDLKSYYSSCDVFVYPSLYEGFGLPPLEAMACGAPVIVSDIPVFREILGDTALFADPNSPEAIADRMMRILNDNNLRQLHINNGLERVKKFSWMRTAEETLSLYDRLIRDKH